MRTWICSLVLALLACSQVPAGPNPVTSATRRRAVEISRAGVPHSFDLDPEILRYAQPSFADLRLVGPKGEVPYELLVQSGSSRALDVNGTLLDTGVVPGVGVRTTVRIDDGLPHNQLKVVTNRDTFQTLTRLESSADGREWSIIRDDAVLTRAATRSGVIEDVSITYPLSTMPFVRVTLRDWTSAKWLQGVTIARLEETAERNLTLAEASGGKVSAEEGRTTHEYSVDAGTPMFDQVHVKAGAGNFERPVQLRLQGQNEVWITTSGVLERSIYRELLVLHNASGRYSKIRLTVTDGDNPPLKVDGLRLVMTVRTVLFVPDVPGEYKLYYGSKRADPPRYDLSALTALRPAIARLTAKLGPAESNPELSLPISDRYPALLYVVVFVAVVLLGALAVRMLRQIPTPGPTA